ncbi:DUF7475 family protein [Halorussus halophilus]|uniref:DUF7475 family protein n=1 Tax=Halorussus halophilus TaxID=2650975 RepID=UPI00130107F9|nr:hypothetical protein [Halorussus halophilus]
MATETRTWLQRDESLTSLDYVGALLAAITGLIHLYEGVEDWGEGFIGVLFVLAGLGFFGAIVLLFLGAPKRPLYLAGIVFTGIQFVAYFVLRWPDIYEFIGLFDKVVQLALVLVLAALYLRSG